MIYGASKEEWMHFDLELGLTADLLPVVSDPNVEISPASKMKALGKTPSIINSKGKAAGIPNWTEKQTRERDIDSWMTDDRLGICIQTRRVRALDIDVEDTLLSKEIEIIAVEMLCAMHAIPEIRRRPNSGKCLVALIVEGELPKRSFKCEGGLVEFLGTGQQFVACGSHSSGVRYEWDCGLPPQFWTITVEEFEFLWSHLVERFAVAPPHERRIRDKSEDFEARDDVAAALIEKGLVLDEGRDGALYVACPWVDGHSMDSGVTEAAWFPAGTGGFEQGHFRCLHASCDGRTDEDFLTALGLGTADDFEIVPEDAPTGGDVLIQADAPRFNRDKQGRIEATLPNLIDALRSPGWTGTAFAIDSFREEVVVSPHGRERWRALRDHDPIRLREWLERRGFKPIGREVMRDALLRVAEDNRFDSAILWLNSLAWDGVPRLDTFLAEHFGCVDNDYTKAVSRYWWTGHAARVLDPGHRCDMVPILISPEGRYKSSTLQALVPAYDNFIEIDLDHKDDDLSRKMRGALLGELAELRGLRGRSAEANKAWVTRRWEEWTPKYQENKVRLARRMMFVGTTNETAFLDATTGRRRWLPVVVGSTANPARLAAARDQLWAEAAESFRRIGEVEWQAAYGLAEAERSNFVIEDVWQAAIERWLTDEETWPERQVTFRFTTEEAFLGALGRPADRVSKTDRDRMADVLRAIFCEYKPVKIDGKVFKRWFVARQVTT
jgi:predicted P-loop ATPase